MHVINFMVIFMQRYIIYQNHLVFLLWPLCICPNKVQTAMCSLVISDQNHLETHMGLLLWGGGGKV